MEACFQANAEKSFDCRFFDILKPSVIHSGTEGFGLWTKERAKAGRAYGSAPGTAFYIVQKTAFLDGLQGFLRFSREEGYIDKAEWMIYYRIGFEC